MNRRLVTSSLVAILLGVAASSGVLLAGYDPPDADIKYDWLSAWGALHSSAHNDVLALADEADVDIAVNAPPGTKPPFPHPRTPGAILVTLPLLLVPFDYLFALSVAVTVTLTAGLVLWAARGTVAPPWLVFFLGTALSAPFFISVRFAGQASVVAVLTLSAWHLYRKRSDMTAGLLLAIAGSLKVFPLALLIPAMFDRRLKPVGYTLSLLVVLNLAGLALPGVDVGGTFNALTQAAESWLGLPANGSLVRALVEISLKPNAAQIIALAVGVVFLLYAVRRRSGELMEDPLPWLIAALLVIPLAWVSYDLLLLPAAVVMMTSERRNVRLGAIAVWALWVAPVIAFPIAVVELGYPSLIARGVLAFGWAAGWLVWRDRPAGWIPVQSAPGMTRRIKLDGGA